MQGYTMKNRCEVYDLSVVTQMLTVPIEHLKHRVSDYHGNGHFSSRIHTCM